MSNYFADNIRFYRKKSKLTQTELADKLFVAPQTVSKWESGISSPDLDRLCAMSDIFGISLDTLIRSATEASREAYIAIDGGGTKTKFVLFNDSGEVIDSILLGGTNPNSYRLEAAEKTLAEGIDKLISRGIRICGCFAGISGASVGENKERLTSFLKSRYPYINFRIEGDIHNVINSAGNFDKCIAVISGTGSVVYGYDGRSLRRAGGWGYLFDEAGSGFDIGRDLFRYCLACEDGFAKKTELYYRMRDEIGSEIFDNLSSIYSKGKDYIASFSRVAFEFFKKGDDIAVGIIAKTVRRLSELICQVANDFDCGKNVVISGGLVYENSPIIVILNEHIGNDFKIVVPEMPPIFGAAVKCIKIFGGKYNADAFEENFKKSLQ